MPGRDDDKHVGSPMSHLFRRRNGRNQEANELAGVSDDAGASNDTRVTPVDLTAVQADDALLNTLGRADVVRGGDAELVRVLVAWRHEVDTESIPPLVDLDTAVATISAARKPASRRRSALGPVAAAAAVLVIAFAGVGMVAKSAQPGDELFPLTKVLYSKYARSVEAAVRVETELADAQMALNKGDTSQARESLEKVQEQLDVIDEEQGRERLATEHDKLEKMLDVTPTPTPVDPPPTAPPTSPPEVPPTSVSAPESPTTTALSPTETKPPPTSATTAPSPTGSGSEPATAETKSSGGAGPLSSEESSPPPVTASSS